MAHPSHSALSPLTRDSWPFLGGLLLLVTAARLILAATLGMSVDESYSASVARHFSLSYFDHPPLHLWIAGAMEHLIDAAPRWWVRLPFVMIGALSTVLMYQLTDRSFGRRAARLAVLAFSFSPFLSVGAASWVLPDGPMVACALAMAVVFRRALDFDGLRDWGAVGLFAGLGLLSKYLMIFPMLGCFVFLVLIAPQRLRTKGPWLAILIAAITTLPVIIWNAEHAWASLAFQGGRAKFTGIHLGQALGVAVAGGLYAGLPTAVLGCRWLARVLANPARSKEQLWFLCLCGPPLAAFTVIAMWAQVLPHWSMIGWLFVIPPVSARLATAAKAQLQPRYWAQSSLVLLALIVGLAVGQGRLGLLDRWIPGFPMDDPLTEMLDWSELPSTLRDRGLLGADTVIATESFVDAGKVDYALHGRHAVLCLCREPHHYGLLYPLAKYRGGDVVLIANARRKDWLPRAEDYLRDVEPLDDIAIPRGDRPAVILRVARGRLSGTSASQQPSP